MSHNNQEKIKVEGSETTPIQPDVNLNLQRGARGDDVKQLQSFLNTKGANLKTDSIFGPLTGSALQQFQSSQQQSRPVVGSSDNIRRDEAKTNTEADDLRLRSLKSITATGSNIEDLLKQERELLNQQAAFQKETQRQSGAEQIVGERAGQRQEQGGLTTGLIRAGGALGKSGSAIAAEISLIQQHRGALNDITRATRNEINKLEIARQQQDFALIKEAINNINSLEERKIGVEQNFLDNKVKLEKVEQEKQSRINAVLQQAIQNNAPEDVRQRIARSDDGQEAILAAGKFGRDNLIDAKLREIESSIRKNNASADNLTGAGFITDPKERFNAEKDLRKEFETRTGDFRKAKSQINVIRTSYQKALADDEAGKSINASSQGVLVAFQKLLDPTSVVRESEYARSGDGLALQARIEGKVAKIKQGGAGVTADDLVEFAELTEQYLQGYEQSAVNDATSITRTANTYGLNTKNIFSDEVAELIEDKRAFEEAQDFDNMSIEDLSSSQVGNLNPVGQTPTKTFFGNYQIPILKQ